MKKQLFIIAALAAMLCGCSNGQMTLPTDTTLPAATEHVLGLSFNESKAWLEKQGYTYTGVGYIDDLRMFSRGERDTLFNEGGAGVEEALALWLYNDTVGSSSGCRSFHNVQDALSVYRKWSNYIWRNLCPDPLKWGGYIKVAKEEDNALLSGGGKEDRQRYIDGTFERQEGMEYDPGRKEFETALGKLTDFVYLFETYLREQSPKEMELMIQKNNGFITIDFENRNHITQWE
ncbi:MAG: hypothetical protein IJ169_06170 [Paludibacteraceae bacterium]|nr:hypothetical protein [Paludibacteraceae bacterium]